MIPSRELGFLTDEAGKTFVYKKPYIQIVNELIHWPSDGFEILEKKV